MMKYTQTQMNVSDLLQLAYNTAKIVLPDPHAIPLGGT